MHSELKPCPFCGGEASLADTMPAGQYWGYCVECTSEGAGRDTDSEAVEAWNHRTLPQEPSSASMGVVVKALDDWPNAGSYEANEARVYATLLGKYAALRYGSTWALYRDDRLLNSHNSFEDAKTAAQADFDQRVRSCISQPAKGEREGG